MHETNATEIIFFFSQQFILLPQGQTCEGEMLGKGDFRLIKATCTSMRYASVCVFDLLFEIACELGTVFSMSPHSGKKQPQTHDEM